MKQIAILSVCLSWFACGKIWAQPDVAIFADNAFSIEIMNGDDTPDPLDFTDFGTMNLGGPDSTHLFTIASWGSEDIDVASVSATPGTYFTAEFDSPPPPYGFFLPWTFIVTFQASSAPVGVYNAIITIQSTDPDENPFTFAVRAEVTGAPPPIFSEINVQGNGTDIADGDPLPSTADDTDFGSITLGDAPVVHTFTVQNIGDDLLNVTGISLAGAGASAYSLGALDPASPVAPFEYATFTVTFDPATAGIFNATLNIANDDPDENPYNFAITGEATTPPPPPSNDLEVRGNDVVLLNGDATPRTLDGTNFGTNPASMMLPLNHAFVVKNIGAATIHLNTITLTGSGAAAYLLPSNPTFPDTIPPGDSTSFWVSFQPSTDGTFNATVNIANDDPNENPYTFDVTGVSADIPGQEISVAGNGLEISNNDTAPTTLDGTDFGDVSLGSGASNLFYIYNLGQTTLNVGSISISGANPDDFTASDLFVDPFLPPGEVPSGAGGFFSLDFNPAAVGLRQAIVTVANDDPDENPYIFHVQGTGTASLSTWYEDSDGDTYGNPSMSQMAASQPTGYVADNNDCDDTNDAVNPAAAEVCNGIDDDCANGVDDGLTFQNYYLDSDGDGFGDGAAVNDCQAPGSDYVLVDGDCDDSDFDVNPSASEVCDGVDNDCANGVDDGLTSQNYYLDSDGDGFGTGAAVNDCQAPGSDYVLVDGDCDDSDFDVNPSASEVCDGVDNDCANGVDDGLTFQNYYLDSDGDGFGAGAAVNDCQAPSTDYVLLDGDCDDSDFDVNPSASEVCNSVDDDCANGIDDGLTFQNYYLDSDGDGFGAGAAVNDCQAPGPEYVFVDGDCDDLDFDVNPSASEVCDGLDNDCANGVDDGLTFQNYFLDNDVDGFGAGAAVNDCQLPGANYVLVDGDCDDTDFNVNPSASEVCDGLDNDCANGVDDGLTFQDYFLDNDGDGFGAGATVNDCQLPGPDYVLVDGDCDDSDFDINPSTSEVCNGIDDDCANGVDDGLIFQDYFLDNDGDGFGAGAAVNDCQQPGANYVLVNGDCDDSDFDVNPSASEICDGVDNDCDLLIDNGVVFQDYFLDADGDGFGAGTAVNDCQAPGPDYVLLDGDCDDSGFDVNPSASEVCDGLDNDCANGVDDGLTFQNYYLDSDGDGDGAGAAVNDCQLPGSEYVLLDGDCDDSDFNVNPSQSEICDGLDNDCANGVDDGLTFQNYFLDNDGDGFGAGAGVNDCQAPGTDYVLVDGDCDDSDFNVNPSASEVCDGVDNDCANGVDDGLTFQNYFLDNDGDGFGAGAAVNDCQLPGTDYVLLGGDCDDSDFNVNPSASEICDGLDNDCANGIDDGLTFQNYFLDNDADGFGAGAAVNACQVPGANYVLANGDCNDSDFNVNPSATEVCNGIDDNCNSLTDSNDPTVFDNTPPIVTCKNTAVTLNASGTASIAPADVFLNGSDNCGAVNLSSVSPNTFNCSNIGNQTVTLTVNDGHANTATCQATVTVSTDLVANAGANATICNSQSTTLNASATGGSGSYSFLWSPTTGLSASDIPNPVASPTSSTTYTVVITDGNGCSASDAVQVNVNTPPTASITGGNNICLGETTTLTAAGGNSYLWSNGANTPAITVSPSATTTYSVTVTAANTCTASTSITVTVNQLPVANISAPAAICEGSDLNLMENGGSPGVTWAWSGPNGFTSSVQNPISANVTSANAGTYSVTVSFGNNCANTATASVLVNPNPVANAGPDANICMGDTTQLQASGAGPGGSYTWSPTATLDAANVPNPMAFPIATTSYIVTVTDANNCTDTDGVQVSVQPLPSISGITDTCDLSFQFYNVHFTATGDSLAASAGTVSNLGADEWTVTDVPSGTNLTLTSINLSTGCASSEVVNAPNCNCPSVAAPNPEGNADLEICQGQNLPIFTATAGIGETVDWYNAPSGGNLLASGSTDFTPTGAGEFYAETRVETSGCTSSVRTKFTLTIHQNPVADAGANSSICLGETAQLDGSASSSPNGGLSYAWSPAASLNDSTQVNPLATPSSNATYFLVVEDAVGCADTTSVDVLVNTVNAPTAGPDQTVCVGTPYPSLSVTVSSGETADWYDAPSGGNLLAAGTTSFTPAGTGIFYAETVNNSTGCHSINRTAASLILNPQPIANIAPNGPTSFCQGGSVQLTASGGTSYAWSTGESTASIVAVASGNFEVIVTDNLGCKDTTSIGISVNPLPSLTFGPTACDVNLASYSFDVTALGADQLTATPLGTVAGGSGNYTVSAPSGQDLTLIATNTATGCFAEQTVIGPDCNCPTLSPPVSSGNQTICQGVPNPVLAVTVGTGETADWYVTSTGGTALAAGTTSFLPSQTSPGTYTFFVETRNTSSGCTSSSRIAISLTINPLPTATIALSGPITFCQGGSVTLTASGGNGYLWSTSQATAAISAVASGNYQVTVSDANGCSATASTSVNVNPLPTATITPGGPTTFCQGGSVQLTASGGNGFLWSTTEATASISAIAGGNYEITVSDANGCSATASTSVTVNPLPTATIALSGPITFCQGGSVALTATGGNGYLWSTSEATDAITVIASGIYEVTVTDANGCSATTSTSITVNPLPTATITPGGPTTFCQGGSVQLTASGGNGFLWSTTEATAFISAIASGNYEVTVTDANGCSATASTSVTVNPLPTATISLSGPITFCQGGSVALTATGGNGYLWSTSEATATISAIASGNYQVTVTDANGCSATASTSVTVNPLPTAAITGTTSICDGEMTTLNASGGNIFNWSTTETTASIDVSPQANTSYTVTVTDANNCAATASATVIVNALPTANAGADAVFCSNASSVQLDGSGSSGAGVLSFEWSPVATLNAADIPTPLASPLADETYVLTLTDANGCVSTDTVKVSLHDAPVGLVSNNSPICTNEDLELVESVGDAIEWLWTTPSGLSKIEQNPVLEHALVEAGTYSLVITDVNGCKETTVFDVVFSAGVAFEAKFLTANVACEGDTVHFIEISQTTELPDAFVWDFGDGTGSSERDPAHVYTTAGTYQVSVVVTEAGCENFSIAKEISVNDCRPAGGSDGFAVYKLYPAINSGKFTLELELVERGLLRLSLQDLNGRVIWAETKRDILIFEEEMEITAPGIYFLKAQTSTGSKVFILMVMRA